MELAEQICIYSSEEEEMRKEKKGNTNQRVIWSFLSYKQKVRVIQADAPACHQFAAVCYFKDGSEEENKFHAEAPLYPF